MRKLADTTRKDYRIFGMLLGSIFMVVWSLNVLLRGVPVADAFSLHPVASTLGCVGAVLFLFGLLIPSALRYPYVPFFYLGQGLARANTWLLLVLSYGLMILPLGIFLRIFRKDPMERKWDPDAASYWTPRPETKRRSAVSERQF